MVHSARIVIIGAGLAGASTAYHLTLRGASDVLVLEQEEAAGMHASGRNAGMVRQVVSGRSIVPFVCEGATFIRRLPSSWPVPTEFKQTGSMLLGAGEKWKRLMADARMSQDFGVPVACLSAEEAARKVPILDAEGFEGAVWCPADGVVDVQGLLQGYLRLAAARGARIFHSSKVLRIQTKGGKICEVITPLQRISADIVINAAGAWASVIGHMAGAAPLPLLAYRRHLFFTDFLPWVEPDWPLVWDVTEEVYFRPASGGLLLSPCDQVEHPPGIPAADPEVATLLWEKLRRCSRLNVLPIKVCMAGLRTLAKDDRFVIGWDPIIQGFFWVAGLGGHGVTVSASIGKLSADLILQEDREESRHFLPARFLGH